MLLGSWEPSRREPQIKSIPVGSGPVSTVHYAESQMGAPYARMGEQVPCHNAHCNLHQPCFR
jgi:hypothetical protein